MWRDFWRAIDSACRSVGQRQPNRPVNWTLPTFEVVLPCLTVTFVGRFADGHPLKGDTGGSAAEACPECFSVYEPVLGEHRAQHSGGGGEIREDGNSVNFVSASVAACWVHTLSVACVQHRSQSSSRLAHSPLLPTAGRNSSKSSGSISLTVPASAVAINLFFYFFIFLRPSRPVSLLAIRHLVVTSCTDYYWFPLVRPRQSHLARRPSHRDRFEHLTTVDLTTSPPTTITMTSTGEKEPLISGNLSTTTAGDPKSYQALSQQLASVGTSHPNSIITYCIHGRDTELCCEMTCTKDGKTNSVSQKIDLPHCHTYDEERSKTDKQARFRLILASILCLLFMLVEVVGGVLANSLAIASDAAHLLTDFASFMISLFSIWMATRPASRRMSFGWHRAEVVGALTSVLLIWVVTGILCYVATERIIENNFEVDASIMVITAAVGVAVNLIMGMALTLGGVPHGHSHSGGGGHGGYGGHLHSGDHHHKSDQSEVDSHGNEEHAHSHDVAESGTRSYSSSKHQGKGNINVRAAFVHVLGDFFQSLGVLIASLVIYFFPEYHIIDPICTFIFSVIVLFTTFTIIRDVLNVLMEGIPKGIDMQEVQKTLFNIRGVRKVHNLRIWSLSLDKAALSTHLAIEKGYEPSKILNDALREVKSRYDIFELTIQIEQYQNEMRDCERCN